MRDTPATRDRSGASRSSDRRTVLKTLGAGAVGAPLASSSAAAADAATALEDSHGRLDLLGHHPGERPTLDAGIYTQGSVRNDGQYAVLGGYYGTIGSSLFDLSEPEQPVFLHRLSSSEEHRQNGVKFLEAVDGIYLRTMEANVGDPSGPADGIQVVDYGWGEGTPESPELIATFEVPGGVHKLDTHPEEPVAYLTDKRSTEPGTWVVDLSDPANPEKATDVGPNGYDHAPWVDAERDLLYSAFAGGEFGGFAIRDISDPYDPEVISQVSYQGRPDYSTIGEPGFEVCHFACHDPERDLLIVGDEVGSGVPGGKHVWDIGWGDGSVTDPQHLGFTHSPNAETQGQSEPFFWTTHVHDVVPETDTENGRTLLVDGGYHEGTWLCDITDPTDPQPAQQHLHHEAADVRALEAVPPAASFLDSTHMPFAWSAEYNAEQEFVLVSDCLGGVFTFSVSDEPFAYRDPGEAFAGVHQPQDRVTFDDLRTAVHYWRSHEYVPNSGRQPMDAAALLDVIGNW